MVGGPLRDQQMRHCWRMAKPGWNIAHRFIADGDHVVESVGKMQTRTSVPYNNEYCLIYRLKNGKIVQIRDYCDFARTEKVLRAVSGRAKAGLISLEAHTGRRS